MKLPEGYVNGVAPKKATAMGGFGQQMLERMGWQKGRGLGKESQGISAPLEAVKKDDTVGLGGKRTWDWEHDYAASAYEQAMAKMNVDTTAAGSSSGSDSSSSSDSEDEPATDDSARSASLQFAGVISSASASELKLARQLAKGNNLGRFGARSGKLERIREQEAVLAAQVDEMKASPQRTAGEALSRQNVRSAKTVVIESTEPAEVRPPPPLQPSSWWGHKAFVSSGWLEGLNETDKPKKREEFTASTQEDIYNRVKESQRQGKAGMGKRRGRDAAADWKGSKVVFDDASEPTNHGCDADVTAAEDSERKGRKKMCSKVKKKVLKIAKGLIKKSKRQRIKRVRLEAAVAEEMSCTDRKACKRLQAVLDGERLAVADKWVVLK